MEATEYYIEGTGMTDMNPLLIIDTPGFIDTSSDKNSNGTSKDDVHWKKISEKIKSLERLDGVCYVSKFSDNKINVAMKYVQLVITNFFGKDFANNIATIATFCDGSKVLLRHALEASDVFKAIKDKADKKDHNIIEFNNSVVFEAADEAKAQQQYNYW